MTQPRDWDVRGSELAAEALAAGEPTRWFDLLYAAGVAGEVAIPWDRDQPHPLLRAWAESKQPQGAGRRAVVVGCGLGADAEYLSALGFATTGFDVAPTAVDLALRRHPDSRVDYQVADLLDLPAAWMRAFDVVVEIFTVQALPDPPRTQAVQAIAGLVASGGTLLAIAFRRTDADDPAEGPPFALSRPDMEGLAVDGLELVAVDELDAPSRWRAEYARGTNPDD